MLVAVVEDFVFSLAPRGTVFVLALLRVWQLTKDSEVTGTTGL